MINIFIEFILFFVLCYLLYLFMMVLKKKRNKFNSQKLRMEEAYLITKYNIDFKKFNKKDYKKFLHLISLVNSFIISFTLIIVNIFKSIFLKILLSFVVLVPLILISYMIIGNHYQKKGMIKDV